VALAQALAADPPPGYVAGYMYRLDSGNNEYITAAVYTDKETYQKNADDARQQRWFQRVQELLAGDPEWHDGELVHAVDMRSKVG
jgi:antibiotic biosynthesis monooxygenase (ABM) superfamily enzyme